MYIGIHGLPKLPWNNIQAAQAENDREVGYCIHGDVLFPSWHRPYLALLEVRDHQGPSLQYGQADPGV